MSEPYLDDLNEFKEFNMMVGRRQKQKMDIEDQHQQIQAQKNQGKKFI